MGFYQTQGASETPTTHEALAHNSISQEEEGIIRPTVTSAGRIVVYGDSNCADNSHMQKGFTILIDTVILFFINISYVSIRLLLDAGRCFGLCCYWRRGTFGVPRKSRCRI